MVYYKILDILGWPKSSFGFFHNILQKTPIELFGQPNSSLCYTVGPCCLFILYIVVCMVTRGERGIN